MPADHVPTACGSVGARGETVMPKSKPGSARRKASRARRRAASHAALLDKFWDTKSFLALSRVEKEQVWRSLNREIRPEETRPLSAAQRRQWSRIRPVAGGAVILALVLLPLSLAAAP